MSTINEQTREIALKIVYYGPGLGGKTTSLQAIHGSLMPESRGQLIMLATGNDRTLYFDFLPIRTKVRDFTVRLQLYTVPGQVHYNSTRKLVLSGADGVVFVADSQRGRLSANDESLANLEDNLRDQGVSLRELPFVIQYNKRDAPDAVPVAELGARLNKLAVPAFETVASERTGVLDALKAITKRVLDNLQRRGAVSVTGSSARRSTPVAGVPSPVPAGRSGPQPAATLTASLEKAAEAVERVDASATPPTKGLAELTDRPTARQDLTAVERAIAAGDWAAAVRRAVAGYRRLAPEMAGGRPAAEAGPLAALLAGLPGTWYQRFTEVEARVASQGGVSYQDALFALLFLAATALRATELAR